MEKREILAGLNRAYDISLQRDAEGLRAELRGLFNAIEADVKAEDAIFEAQQSPAAQVMRGPLPWGWIVIGFDNDHADDAGRVLEVARQAAELSGVVEFEFVEHASAIRWRAMESQRDTLQAEVDALKAELASATAEWDRATKSGVRLAQLGAEANSAVTMLQADLESLLGPLAPYRRDGEVAADTLKRLIAELTAAEAVHDFSGLDPSTGRPQAEPDGIITSPEGITMTKPTVTVIDPRPTMPSGYYVDQGTYPPWKGIRTDQPADQSADQPPPRQPILPEILRRIQVVEQSCDEIIDGISELTRLVQSMMRDRQKQQPSAANGAPMLG